VKWQRQFGKDWRIFIDTKLRPALYHNDLFAFLKLGWELNSLSNMKLLEGIFDTDVLRDFDGTMEREGALYAGMSSAGPGFFAFSDSEKGAKRIAGIMESRFGKYMGGFAVARAGEKMVINISV
jgi:predicted sugar kinase